MRAHDHWRDRVLTGLTFLMALDFFIIAPARAIDAFDFRAFSIITVILLSGALVVLSRSMVPIFVIIGGLVSATLLTLIVLPTLYLVMMRRVSTSAPLPQLD